jgi:ABC-type polysaccharide/polyol phosphate transport system ATPase subunit
MPHSPTPQPQPQRLAPETESGRRIAFTGVGVEYLLLDQDQRTLKGRVLNLFGPADPAARFWALRNISASIGRGEIVGVIGKNGSGKSTLLRVMAGVIEPTEGTVSVAGRVTPLLELGAAINPELTGRENTHLYGAILKKTRPEVDELIPRILEFAELGPFFDVPVKCYSSGMLGRLAFAISTQIRPEILLIDEVLSVGDEQFQKKSFFRIQKLIEGGSIVVLVSHNSEVIRKFCNRAIYLSQGQIVEDGKTAIVLARYQHDSARNA